jgi:GABA(A) receptor-associated protein
MFNEHIAFKRDYSLEDRRVKSFQIRAKYPDKIPVICEKLSSCKNIIQISKKKFLVAMEYTCGQFIYIIRNQLKLPSEQAIFLFVNGHIPASSQTMSQLFEEHRDPDGFLYVNYASENTFG